ncbi:MAG: preprotein translocase subunit YajC [Rhodocyclaceae bacterium]|nr:preprotein translocase subunit YajC [Rhodocyclaceae bacterium]
MLISNAYAQAAGAASQDPLAGLGSILPMVVIFAVMWFLMIRPQMKRAKEQKAMIEALAKGDEVVTQGGVAGRVEKLGDTYIQLEVAENVKIAVAKNAVAAVLPKGTLKSL